MGKKKIKNQPRPKLIAQRIKELVEEERVLKGSIEILRNIFIIRIHLFFLGVFYKNEYK